MEPRKAHLAHGLLQHSPGVHQRLQGLPGARGGEPGAGHGGSCNVLCHAPTSPRESLLVKNYPVIFLTDQYVYSVSIGNPPCAVSWCRSLQRDPADPPVKWLRYKCHCKRDASN